MGQCPNCKRSSLEFSEGKLIAWCLYSECAFCTPVKNYQDYAAQFEKPEGVIASEVEEKRAFAKQNLAANLDVFCC